MYYILLINKIVIKKGEIYIMKNIMNLDILKKWSRNLSDMVVEENFNNFNLDLNNLDCDKEIFDELLITYEK